MGSNGQTIADRLAAARHVIDGSTVNKAVVKATTHEIQGPKRKHLDYLVTLTGAPNVNLPELANHLVERTRNTSWVVVFKALVTTHHLMCYGNERFLQSCASRLCLFSLQDFQNKPFEAAGFEMSAYIRRYSRYLNEKSASYRSVAYDFTRSKRKDETSPHHFKNMSNDNLLKTLQLVQSQIDALLEFNPNTNELSNGVINACFVLLFKDLIRLFGYYNDGIIYLLQKFFEMKKQQCKDGLEIYKKYLVRMEKIQSFLKVAENVGIDKGDMPDLTSAPSSLLDALQDHLSSMEGKRSGTVSPTTPVSQTEAERVIADERRRLEEYAKKSKPGVDLFGAAPIKFPSQVTSPTSQQQQLPPTVAAVPQRVAQPAVSSKPASADLLDLDMSGSNTLNNIMAMHNAKQHQQPFGQQSPFGAVSPQQQQQQQASPFGAPPSQVSNPFAAMGQVPNAMSPPMMQQQQQQPMGFGMPVQQQPQQQQVNPFAQQQQQQQFGAMNMGMANMNMGANPFGAPPMQQPVVQQQQLQQQQQHQQHQQAQMASNPFAGMGAPPQQSRSQQPVNLLD